MTLGFPPDQLAINLLIYAPFAYLFLGRRRTGLRNRVMSSGVSRIHHGPCEVAWMLFRHPDLHQAAMVDTSTFRALAAVRAEQRPSPRSPRVHAAGPSGQLLGIPWT